MKLPTITVRGAGEPVADLTAHRVAHRAMCLDVHSLAELNAAGNDVVAAEEQRSIAVRDYLSRVFAVIRSHHETEDEVLWPVIEAAAGAAVGPAMLARHTADHHWLGRLLDHAQVLIDQLPAGYTERGRGGALSTELRVLGRFLEWHVAREERHVFPLITCHVGVEAYAWVLQQSWSWLPSAQLPFAVPWLAHHATPDELSRMLAPTSRRMHVLLQIFDERFTAQHRLVFGAAN